MLRTILFNVFAVILLLLPSANAAELVTDFSDNSIPVLNEELRKISSDTDDVNDSLEEETAAREAADTSLQSSIDSINVRFQQMVYSKTSTGASTSSTIPLDNTKPQSSEGYEAMTASITPAATDNDIYVEVIAYVDNSAGQPVVAALFKDSGTDALVTGIFEGNVTETPSFISMNYLDEDVGSTSSTTYKVRVGANSGTTYFNQRNGNDLFNGTFASSITLTEIDPD